MDPFAKIEDFYRRVVKLPIPEYPQRLTPEQKASAVEHWDEERKEFLDAETIEDEIDACIDLAWLALGRVIEMGADLPAHFDEVARANGERVPGRNPKRPLSTGFDAVKPEGWRGPDHSAVLTRSLCTPPAFRRNDEVRRVMEFLDWLDADKPTGTAFCLEIGHGPQSRRIVVEHPKLLRQELTRRAMPMSRARVYDACDRVEEETTDAGKGFKAQRIILVGHGRHGKDTVAEMLRDRYGYRFVSSSLFCAEKVMLPAFNDAGVLYTSITSKCSERQISAAEACFNDRHGESELVGDHRTFWFKAIKAYCTPDKARLAREIFEEHDLYVGIRDRRELWAAQLLPGVLTVWVDASDRLPPEQASSMNIEPWMADLVLDNNGSIEDLSRSVDALMAKVSK